MLKNVKIRTAALLTGLALAVTALPASSATVSAEPTEDGTVAMQRLYNPNSGEHFYTASEGEKDNLVNAGWNYEGIGWYAVKEGIPYVKPTATSSGKINVDEFMAAVDNVYKTAEAEGWHYGGSRTKVPCADKVISCDRLIARAIYDMGYTDQPAGGYGLSGHGLENYLSQIGFTASKNDWSAIRRGSVMFVNKDGDPTDYEHAFVVDAYDPQTTALTRYDAGVVGRVSPVIHATNNPFPSWWDHDNFLVMNP